MRRRPALLAAVAALVLVAGCERNPTSVTQSQGGTLKELSGTYDIIRALNPDGTTYRGQVSISPKGAFYKFVWEVPGSDTTLGVGLRVGDIVGVGWSDAQNHAVAVYRVSGGSLTGKWAAFNSFDQLGVEDLEGPPNLNGTYKITQGKNPDTNTTYGGTVQIAPAGKVYSVRWALSDGMKYSGVGLLEGDLFVVGYAFSGSPAVTAYSVVGKELRGRWVQPGTNGIGNEDLAKG